MNEPLPINEYRTGLLHKTRSAAGEARDLRIDILGEKFVISTDEEPEYLNEILAQYKIAVSNTMGISGIKEPLRIAILTGFLICDQFNKFKQQVRKEMEISTAEDALQYQKLENALQKIITRIENVTDEDSIYENYS